MKLRFEWAPGVEMEIEKASFAEAFDRLAQAKQAGPEPCGQCQKTEIAFVSMSKNGRDFRSFRCITCGAQLDLFLNQQNGSLFKVRKNKEGQTKGVNGWVVWTPQGQQQQNTAYSQPATANDGFDQPQQPQQPQQQAMPEGGIPF